MSWWQSLHGRIKGIWALAGGMGWLSDCRHQLGPSALVGVGVVSSLYFQACIPWGSYPNLQTFLCLLLSSCDLGQATTEGMVKSYIARVPPGKGWGRKTVSALWKLSMICLLNFKTYHFWLIYVRMADLWWSYNCLHLVRSKSNRE